MNPPAPPSPGASPRPTPLPLGRIATVVAILVGIAAVAGLLPRWRAQAALAAETRELALPTVWITSPAPGKTGLPPAFAAEVRPLQEAPIYARASGYLKRWLVDLGSQVEAGQLLAEIDSPELQQELARARAEAAQAEAAQALARATAARWADLLKTAAVSAHEAEEKQSDLALKSALLDGARANMRRLEELQSFTRVTAPFAGVITARRVDVGELVSATGGRELFRLTQSRTLRVFVRVPQTAARAITIGQAAELTVPELPGRVYALKVVRTAGAMDPTSRTLLTELEADNAQGELLAGSFAQVRFPHAKVDAALVISANALLFRAEGTCVATVDGAGKATVRVVTLGRDFGSTVEILAGLSLGDRVIVNPPDSIETGAVVRVATASQKEPAK